eukprot:jgi/Tetstr1/443281/TSEL_031315.t1
MASTTWESMPLYAMPSFRSSFVAASFASEKPMSPDPAEPLAPRAPRLEDVPPDCVDYLFWAPDTSPRRLYRPTVVLAARRDIALPQEGLTYVRPSAPSY